MSEDTRKISVRFVDAPFAVAMSSIADETGAAIVWASACDKMTVSGAFSGASVADVLTLVSRRCGVKMVRVGDVYFLGEQQRTDLVIAVTRLPAVDPEVVKAGLAGALSEVGSVSVIGSCLVVTDTLEFVRRILAAVDTLKSASKKGYIAEVFFVRMLDEDLISLQAKLDAQNVDIFQTSFRLGELFQCYLDASGTSSRVSVDSRPILYLSEGRETVLDVGNQLTLAQNSVSEHGYSTTTGYQNFEDGVKLSLTPTRLEKGVYSLAFNLSISQFDSGSSSTSSASVVPALSRSVLSAPGLVVTDGGVFFVGSLSSKVSRRSARFVGVSGGSTSEVVTVWVRVRELSLSM